MHTDHRQALVDAERAEGIMGRRQMRQAAGAPSPSGKTMREVRPGDRIMHYVGGSILAAGIAATSAFDPPAGIRGTSVGYQRLGTP